MKIVEWVDGLTLHGIRHIFIGNGNKFSRIFWVVALIASMSGLVFNYHLLYWKFDKTPDINVRIKHRFTSEIPFPAITVCNPLFAKNGLVKFYNISKLYRKNPNANFNLSIEEQNYFASNIHACSPEIGFNMKSKLVRRTEYDIIKLLNESSLTLSEAIINCYYKGFYRDCTNIFNRILTDRGFCYSFNMQGFNTIFNEKLISKDFNMFKRLNITKSLDALNKHSNEIIQDENETLKWSLDQRYAENHDSDSVPVKASKGKVVKFNAILKEVDATNVCTVFGNVFSLFIHLPNEIMLPLHREYYAEFRKMKDIILTAKSYTADESMRKFTPRARGCYFEGEKQLKFFKTYTKSLCEFECMTNYTLRTCGCVKFSMPRTSSTPVCSLDKIKCYLQAMNVWPDHSKNKDRFDITCGCLKTCNDIKYNVKFDKISSAENVMLIFELYNLTKRYLT